LASALDKARLEHVLGRRRDREIAELHVELGGKFLVPGEEAARAGDAAKAIRSTAAVQRIGAIARSRMT
jgi:hypothetical protein